MFYLSKQNTEVDCFTSIATIKKKKKCQESGSTKQS